MLTKLRYELIPVSLPSADQVHLTRFYRDKNQLGAPVFMLHSVLHDSRTFFTDEGGGLACYLARQGYDVYVADLRGKGSSWPSMTGASTFGCHHAINEDIPALLKKIVSKRGRIPQIWVGHGWGSVLLCSYYARYGDSLAAVEKMIHFAARRRLTHSTLAKRFTFDMGWRQLARLMVAMKGFLPAMTMGLASSHESAGTYRDYLHWSDSKSWCDSEDDFNYGEAIGQRGLPPSYYFAGRADHSYGEIDDVRAFINELGPHDGRLMLLGKREGNLHQYKHLDMVRHHDAERDHFPLLLEWLQQNY